MDIVNTSYNRWNIVLSTEPVPYQAIFRLQNKESARNIEIAWSEATAIMLMVMSIIALEFHIGLIKKLDNYIQFCLQVLHELAVKMFVFCSPISIQWNGWLGTGRVSYVRQIHWSMFCSEADLRTEPVLMSWPSCVTYS